MGKGKGRGGGLAPQRGICSASGQSARRVRVAGVAVARAARVVRMRVEKCMVSVVLGFGGGVAWFGSVLVELEMWLWREERDLRMVEVEESIYGFLHFTLEYYQF